MESSFPHLDHVGFMRRAIIQAKNLPQRPFGTVIVHADSGAVIAHGFNRSSEDPTHHGEMVAIHRCADQHPGIDWSQLALYTTAEPCPMCQSAIAWTGIGLVAYGTSIPFLQGLGWHQVDIRAEEVARRAPFRRCVILGGILEDECNALFLAVGPASSSIRADV